MKERVFFVRRFLNSNANGGMAAILASVKKSDRYSEGVDGDLQISDCNRLIALDVYAHDKARAEEVDAKLTALIDTLRAFHRAWRRQAKRAKIL